METPGDREGAGGTAHGVRYHPEQGSRRVGNDRERAGQLRHRAESPVRGAVTGTIERDDREPARDEWLDERRRKPAAAATPAMHQGDRRALPPGPRGHSPIVHADAERPAGCQEIADRWRERRAARAAPRPGAVRSRARIATRVAWSCRFIVAMPERRGAPGPRLWDREAGGARDGRRA